MEWKGTYISVLFKHKNIPIKLSWVFKRSTCWGKNLPPLFFLLFRSYIGRKSIISIFGPRSWRSHKKKKRRDYCTRWLWTDEIEIQPKDGLIFTWCSNIRIWYGYNLRLCWRWRKNWRRILTPSNSILQFIKQITIIFVRTKASLQIIQESLRIQKLCYLQTRNKWAINHCTEILNFTGE